MIENVLKLARDGTSRGDWKVLNQSLKELRYAFKVFAPYRRVRKVTVFGSARTPEDAPAYQQARRVREPDAAPRARWSSPGAGERHHGGGPGRRGARPQLRREHPAARSSRRRNEFIAEDPKLIHFKYFFTRKLMFIKEADAIALFPGGFGTHDEGFES